jgi:hypothetical protein
MDYYPSQTITENGVTKLELAPGEWSLKFKGDFGGGTLSIGYDAADGDPVEYPDGSLEASGGVIAAVSAGERVIVTLTGATDPAIKVRVGRINP